MSLRLYVSVKYPRESPWTSGLRTRSPSIPVSVISILPVAHPSRRLFRYLP